MTELETKLLAQMRGLISAIESNSGAEPSLSVLCREVDLAKALIAEAEATQPFDDGWIPWEGGECPVDLDTPVHIRLRDGSSSLDGDPLQAREWYWSAGLGDGTIAAYLIVGEPK